MSLPMPTITMDPAILKEMDAPLVELARKSNGDLRKLLYAFFSFLHRRTDFYCVPHDDDIAAGGHRLGFKEGEAEQLLLAAFRQFPLRKMPKQTKLSPDDPPGRSIDQQKTKQKTEEIISSSGESHATSAVVPAPRKWPTRKADNEDPMEHIRFTDEGKQVPVGNGGSASSYRWTQTIDEVSVIVVPPKGTKGKDLSVEVKGASVSVKMKHLIEGETEPLTVLEGKLSDQIQANESTWSLEGGVITLTLQKARKTWWEHVLAGDPKIDTSLVDSRRRIDEYGESTQGAIRRILFDQQQQQLGKPTSDQILRARGKNPLPDLPQGVEYIDSVTLDGATNSRSES